MAPMNKGTTIAIAKMGTPEAITTSKRLVTEPVISIISRRYSILTMDKTRSHLTPFLNIIKPCSGLTLPRIIATKIPASSEPQIGRPNKVQATVTMIGIPPFMASIVKPPDPVFFLGVVMKPLLAIKPMAVITKKRGH